MPDFAGGAGAPPRRGDRPGIDRLDRRREELDPFEEERPLLRKEEREALLSHPASPRRRGLRRRRSACLHERLESGVPGRGAPRRSALPRGPRRRVPSYEVFRRATPFVRRDRFEKVWAIRRSAAFI